MAAEHEIDHAAMARMAEDFNKPGVMEPDFNFPHKWRTARKQHICEVCGSPIVRGNRYLEYLGDVPLFQSGSRSHKACALHTWEG